MGGINSQKPIIVGLASIWAGGGHNALRDILAEELNQHPEFQCHSFTHSDSSYDWFNDNIFGKAPIFLNFLFIRMIFYFVRKFMMRISLIRLLGIQLIFVIFYHE